MSHTALQLQNVLDLLSKPEHIHICIHDLTGFTRPESLRLLLGNYNHTAPFCETAKATARGMKRCFACKVRTVRRSLSLTEPTVSLCCMGIYEIAMPVIAGGKTIGILFIGNIAAETEILSERIRRGARVTGVPESALLEQLPTLCNNRDFEYYRRMAAFLSEYILQLYHDAEPVRDNGHHWAVEAIQRYVNQYTDKNLKINDIARLFHINTNYAGRLFKKEIGLSFSAYLNQIRIEKACHLLKTTSQNILQISMSVGYDNVTYFNRVFQSQMGMTPTTYRSS